jgi:hypothetical protein
MWRVEVKFDQRGDETNAAAELPVGNATYEAHGRTHGGELDASVARELAAARALAALAHQLVHDASHTVGRAARAVAAASEEAQKTLVALE